MHNNHLETTGLSALTSSIQVWSPWVHSTPRADGLSSISKLLKVRQLFSCADSFRPLIHQSFVFLTIIFKKILSVNRSNVMLGLEGRDDWENMSSTPSLGYYDLNNQYFFFMIITTPPPPLEFQMFIWPGNFVMKMPLYRLSTLCYMINKYYCYFFIHVDHF